MRHTRYALEIEDGYVSRKLGEYFNWWKSWQGKAPAGAKPVEMTSKQVSELAYARHSSGRNEDGGIETPFDAKYGCPIGIAMSAPEIMAMVQAGLIQVKDD